MSTADRVDKFSTDCQTLLKTNNTSKIISEIKKLSLWLQKHQSEIIPDNHKQLLLTTIESYYNYYSQNRDSLLLDAVMLLVDDCLKLPEGKLINSKGKKRALKWIDVLHSYQSSSSTAGDCIGLVNGSTSSGSIASSTTSQSYIVISLQQHNKSISVMDEETGEKVIENIIVSSMTQWKALKKHFTKSSEQEQEVSDVVVYLSNSEEEIIKLIIDGIEII